jgi:hypothetical protein
MASELEDLIRERWSPTPPPDENGDESSAFDELPDERASDQLDTAIRVLSQFMRPTGAVGTAHFWRGVNTLRDLSEQSSVRHLYVLGGERGEVQYVGETAGDFRSHWRTSTPLRHDTHVHLTAFRPRAEAPRLVSPARQQFDRLAARWHEETDHLSSLTDIVLNFNYQRIIGMGPAALPFIFDEFRTNGGHWFWALRAITGEDPVPPQDRGNMSSMKNAWLEWWRKHA